MIEWRDNPDHDLDDGSAAGVIALLFGMAMFAAGFAVRAWLW